MSMVTLSVKKLRLTQLERFQVGEWEYLHTDVHDFWNKGDASPTKKARTRGEIYQILFLDYGLQSITEPQSDYTVIHFRTDYRKTVIDS